MVTEFSAATKRNEQASRQRKESTLRFGRDLEMRIAHAARSFQVRYRHRRSGQLMSAMDHPFWHGNGIGVLPGQSKFRRALLNALPAEIGVWIKRMRFPWLTHADIAEMWKRMDTVRRIADDNIRLLPVWLLLANERRLGLRMPEAQPLLAMKMQLQTLGISSRTWRSLCRFGVRVLPPIPGHELGNAFRRFEQVVAYLRLAGLDDVANFTRPEKWCTWWFANETGDALWEFGPELPRAALIRLRRGVAHWDTHDINELDYMIDFEGMADVVESLAEPTMREAFACLPANKRGKRWHWWQELPEHLRREIARYSRNDTPDLKLLVRVGAYSQGLYNVVPLSTEREVVDEGTRMNHCLRDGFRRHYDRKTTWLHSIRDTAEGTSLATVAIETDSNGFPHISEAQGHANGAAPAHVTPIILDLLMRHCAAEREAALPKRKANKGASSRPILPTGVRCLDEEVGGLHAAEVTALVGSRNELIHVAHTCISHVVDSEQRDVVFVATHAMRSAVLPARSRECTTRTLDTYEFITGGCLSRGLIEDSSSNSECVMVDAAQVHSIAKLRSLVDEISQQASPALIVIEAVSDMLDELDSGRIESMAKFLGLPILVLCAPDLHRQGTRVGKACLLKRLRRSPGNFILIDHVAA